MNWNRYQPIIVGGLFIGVLSALPLINIANCCCLWVLAGGAIAAHLRQQQQPTIPITAGDGAFAGLLAGLAGAVVWLIVSTPIHLIMGPLQARMLENVLQQARDVPESMRFWTTGLRTGAFTVVQLFIGFCVMLVVGALFGAIGGALGVAIFGKRQPPVAPPVVPPQPPPA